MLVHLLYRPLPHPAPLCAELFRAWAQCLRATGTDVLEDLQDPVADDSQEAVRASAAALATQWAQDAKPDLIHTFGVAATAMAAQADPPCPLVATFHESPTLTELEEGLAAQVDAVVTLSAQEQRSWEGRGITSIPSGPIPLPVPIGDPNACARPDGDVLTLCSGPDLDELLRSMRHWSGRLVVLAELAACRQTQVELTVRRLGLQDRVELRPSPTARDREKFWRNAAVVYVGVEHSQHAGPVLEAAAHGVPALAASTGANRDLVVAGTTGLLIASRTDLTGGPTDAWNPGPALAALLGEPFWIRALGAAALVRVGSAHSHRTAGAQLTQVYQRVTGGSPLPKPEPVHSANQDTLVVEHMALARQLAGWYSGRGQSSDDLVQVASLGLVHAARRFDPSHGREFHSFAIPTILGELRKHFRDNAWAVRVPRGLQERTLQVLRASETLSQSLGRPPTVAEIAEHLDVVEEEVLLAQQTDGEARSARSLDAPLESEAFSSLIGEDDEALDAIELRHDVRAAIAKLPAREQQILLLRFFGERTQAEISEQLGISQVHVSRVLSRTLAAIRDHVMYDVPLPQPRAG